MKLLLLAIILICSLPSNAQVSDLNALYSDNLPTINPALSGILYKHHGSVSYRTVSQNHFRASNLMANYNTRIFKYHGIGFNYTYISVYHWGNHTANLNYNYQWRLKNTATFSMGFAIGIQVLYGEPNHGLSVQALDTTVKAGIHENLNIGFAYTSRKLEIGISLANITQAPSASNFKYRNVNHLNLHGNYFIPITRKMNLRPMLLLQTDFRRVHGNITLLAEYRKYWFGVGYRTKSTFSAMAGWNIKDQLKLGYAFEHYFSTIAPKGFSNHQVTLGFRIPFPD